MTVALNLRNDPSIEAARDASPEGIRAEIVNGALLMAPAPRHRHQRVCMNLAVLLSSLETRWKKSGNNPPGQDWYFLAVPELHLGPRPDKLNPDLAGWREERKPQEQGAAIHTVPDWICEVLSESTEAYDRGTKLPAFAGHGVSHAWIVDADLRVIEVYRLERGSLRQCARFEGTASVVMEPFDGFQLDLSLLWE